MDKNELNLSEDQIGSLHLTNIPTKTISSDKIINVANKLTKIKEISNNSGKKEDICVIKPDRERKRNKKISRGVLDGIFYGLGKMVSSVSRTFKFDRENL